MSSAGFSPFRHPRDSFVSMNRSRDVTPSRNEVAGTAVRSTSAGRSSHERKPSHKKVNCYKIAESNLTLTDRTLRNLLERISSSCTLTGFFFFRVFSIGFAADEKTQFHAIHPPNICSRRMNEYLLDQRLRCQTDSHLLTDSHPLRVLLAVIGIAIVTLQSEAQAQDRVTPSPLKVIQQQRDRLAIEYRSTLSSLSNKYRQQQNSAAVSVIQSLIERSESSDEGLNELPIHFQPEIADDLPPEEQAWKTRIREIQIKYANDLYLISRRALHAGFPSYAFTLVRDVAEQNPDHRLARRLLGYMPYQKMWVTPFTYEMHRKRMVWHERFGWLPVTHVERYEKGERFYKGRWVTAEYENRVRQLFENAWEVRTEHFIVKTNHSLEKGVEIASALEGFHRTFFSVFASFFNTPQQMRKLFEGNGNGSETLLRRPPYEVHFFKTRAEYINRLRGKMPNIEISNGLYFPRDRVSYFYNDDTNANLRTVFHEATHQFFYESDRRLRDVGGQSHFWIIEGIACYMESYHIRDGKVSLGDPRYTRFAAARYRYLKNQFYVPYRRLAGLGLRQFQAVPEIGKVYSQVSGMAHFLMHYDNGRYRDALIEHLVQLYSSNPQVALRAKPLTELMGISAAEFDRQYGEYTKSVEAKVAQKDQP